MLLNYETPRLMVCEVSQGLPQDTLFELLNQVIELFTPVVVENLPSHFQNIRSIKSAAIWLERMISESLLFVIRSKQEASVIGFLFVSIDTGREAHIGYLLGENYWRKGLASELLRGFIDLAAKEKVWSKLIGGVDKANKASATLLIKLGFVEQAIADNHVIFYEYRLED